MPATAARTIGDRRAFFVDGWSRNAVAAGIARSLGLINGADMRAKGTLSHNKIDISTLGGRGDFSPSFAPKPLPGTYSQSPVELSRATREGDGYRVEAEWHSSYKPAIVMPGVTFLETARQIIDSRDKTFPIAETPDVSIEMHLPLGGWSMLPRGLLDHTKAFDTRVKGIETIWPIKGSYYQDKAPDKDPNYLVVGLPSDAADRSQALHALQYLQRGELFGFDAHTNRRRWLAKDQAGQNPQGLPITEDGLIFSKLPAEYTPNAEHMDALEDMLRRYSGSASARSSVDCAHIQFNGRVDQSSLMIDRFLDSTVRPGASINFGIGQDVVLKLAKNGMPYIVADNVQALAEIATRPHWFQMQPTLVAMEGEENFYNLDKSQYKSAAK